MEGQSNSRSTCNVDISMIENIFRGLMYNRETKEILNYNWETIGKVKQGKIYWNK